MMLQSSSHIEGDIYHQALAIEQGAFFEGKSRRSDDPMAGVSKPDIPGFNGTGGDLTLRQAEIFAPRMPMRGATVFRSRLQRQGAIAIRFPPRPANVRSRQVSTSTWWLCAASFSASNMRSIRVSSE